MLSLHGATDIYRVGQTRLIPRIAKALHDLSLQGADKQ